MPSNPGQQTQRTKSLTIKVVVTFKSMVWIEECGRHEIVGIKERVGGEEIEAVGTDHSF